ncbi:uncharacterized protein [Spinacia oleracea]|uniref:Aminotransferase-like plant mobile domain-containing protein n=1 Tax=Spinacia oleracea TaxID=3562 RepID=A0ABM3QY84_SPIOL|nr:uncharacterized protein LOC130463255 [Spinacia oleracea]
MVYLSEFKKGDDIHLSIRDSEKDDLKTGTHFVIQRSLRRPTGSMRATIDQEIFRSEMAIQVTPGTSSDPPFYVLKSTLPDRYQLDALSPMLGRRILSGSVGWKSKNLRVSGEASFLPGWWEWTEDVLSRFGDILRVCSVYTTVQASLCLYDKDPNIIRAFCESWSPTTNTLHTMTGEWSVSLWDIYKLRGLPILGGIYDETIPDYHMLGARDENGNRQISQACVILFTVYHRLAKDPKSKKGVTAQLWIDFWCKRERIHKVPLKRRRYTESRPKVTNNPDVNIEAQPISWSQEENDLFDSLGVVGANRRAITYVGAFLSCWLCTFVLPQSEDRLIRPGTFETATLMARGETFSLAVPVLTSIYRGLNSISSNSKPSYSKTFFPTHYVYAWLAYYFNTHHDADPVPFGPLMVIYSGAQGSKYFNDGDARTLIHGGAKMNVGCMMLNKNRNEHLFDDGNLDKVKFSYMVALRSSYLVLRRESHDGHFYVEPYSPHRFGRQFGFCQEITGVLRRGVDERSVPYYEALRYWSIILFKDSRSRVFTPSQSLNWKELVTPEFKKVWPTISIGDLRKGVDVLCSGAVSDTSKPKQCQGNEKGVLRQRSDVMRPEGTDDTHKRRSSRTDSAQRPLIGVDNNDKTTSDAESDVDFKHRRRVRQNSDDLSMDVDDLGADGFFLDVPESSVVPSNLQIDGDLDLEVDIGNTATDYLFAQGDDPFLPKSTPGKGKELTVIKDLAPIGSAQMNSNVNLSSSPKSQQSVDGPNSLEVASKALGVRPSPVNASNHVSKTVHTHAMYVS